MVKEILLNETLIQVDHFKKEIEDGLYKIFIDFKVTSKDYHHISILLYEGTFDVKVPEQDLTFRGTIHQYSTSITNLYKEDQVGDYKLCLIEVKN